MAKLNVGHYVVGMEGVALLRTWLRGAAGGAPARVSELSGFLANPHGGPLAIELAVPEKDVHQGYAEWAATYDAPSNPLIHVEEPAVRALIDACAPGVALDAACGSGRHTAYLAARGHRVIGVDTTTEMLDLARVKVPDADLRIGVLEALPVDSAGTDIALCTLALTHLPELGAAIAELARVVRPGGRVILSDQHPVMTLLGGTAFYASAQGDFGYVTSYIHTHAAYLTAFHAAGLVVERCIEPVWNEEAIAIMLAAGGLGGIADDAFHAALMGLPSALVWQLARQ